MSPGSGSQRDRAVIEPLQGGRFAFGAEQGSEVFGGLCDLGGDVGVEDVVVFHVTPETLSRWENGTLAVDENSFLILGDLVEDRCTGSTRTLERLKTRREPKTNKPSFIPLELEPVW